MRIEKHASRYPLDETFPNKRMLIGFEGGAVWQAEKDGSFYLIADEGTMADFLDPEQDGDLLARLVNIYIFDTEVERQAYIRERNWTPQRY